MKQQHIIGSLEPDAGEEPVHKKDKKTPCHGDFNVERHGFAGKTIRVKIFFKVAPKLVLVI